ncbi:MAG: hypothetical protein R3200_15055 [Xanthomonadales bacterium]|nr:hypothetical protein [Xanthomonadales bacterium]
MPKNFLLTLIILISAGGGLGYASHSEAAQFRSTVYFEGAADFFTLVAVTNVGDADETVTIEFIGDEGSFLGETQNVIAPNHTWRVSTAELGIDTRGRMVLTNSGTADDILLWSASITTQTFAGFTQDWEEF